MSRSPWLSSKGLRGWPAIVVCVAAGALVWVGYRAAIEWERAAALVAGRRAEAAVNLLVTALTRDMRGAHLAVLADAERNGLMAATQADLLPSIGSAFARYPYLEAFYAWREQDPHARISPVFYARADRIPAWLATDDERTRFPVVVGREATIGQQLIDRVMRDAAESRRFSIFSLELARSPYQHVAIVSYADPLRERPAAVLGFLVELDWTRAHYFGDLAAVVGRIEGDDGGIALSVLDDHGRSVVGTGRGDDGRPSASREFAVAFFDPLVVAADPPGDLTLASWTAVATAAGDPTLAAAERGGRRTLMVAAGMAVVLTLGLVLSFRAARASMELADMRSEFVATVTHELKTPVANMRAINETLASPRSTIEMSREYAEMGIREATRLTRLIDNLLAYARITDVADAYSFEPVALDAVVDQSLREFASNLRHEQFDVVIDIPEGLPPVRADQTALGLMVNNLLDNAIRYSKDTRRLTIRARPTDGQVTLEVADRGIGIPESELKNVTRKFFRGHGAGASGSGLGLTIVDRIVADHGGTLDIRSEVGAGTTVVITLRVAST